MLDRGVSSSESSEILLPLFLIQMQIEMDNMTTRGRRIEMVIIVSFFCPLGGLCVGFISVVFGGVGSGFGVGM